MLNDIAPEHAFRPQKCTIVKNFQIKNLNNDRSQFTINLCVRMYGPSTYYTLMSLNDVKPTSRAMRSFAATMILKLAFDRP